MFFFFQGKELRPVDEHGKPLYLSDYNIQDEGNLFLVLRLLGGGQKHPADNKQCSCPRLVYFNKLSETRHTWDSLKKQASNSANTEPVPAPSKGSVYVYDYKVARTNNKQPTPTTMNVPGPPEGKESKPYRPNSEQAHGECWQRTEVVEGRPPNVHFEATKTELNVSKQVGGRDHLKTTLAQISTQSNGASKRTERDVGNERKGKISNSEVHLHLSKPRKKPAPPIPETTSKTLYREETPDTPKSQVQTKPTKLEGKSKSPADNRTPKKSEDDPNLLDSENSEETPKPPDPDPDESLAPPKLYGPDVQLTQMPDMFTLDDDEGGQRALMPCKHAIGKY